MAKSGNNPEREAYQKALMQLIGCRPVAYWPHLARHVGGVKAAVMLSQLLYWNGDATVIKRDGWLTKTVADMEVETGLGKLEQQTARSTLKRFGLIECEEKGWPKSWRYKVNVDRLGEILLDGHSGKVSHPIGNPSNGEPTQLDSHSMQNPPKSGTVSDPIVGGFDADYIRSIKTTSSETTPLKTTSSSPNTGSRAAGKKEVEVIQKAIETLSPNFLETLREIGVFDAKLPVVARLVEQGVSEDELCDLIDEAEKKEPNPPGTAALFIWRLEHNWKPGKRITKEQREEIERRSYITGKFADLIQH